MNSRIRTFMPISAFIASTFFVVSAAIGIAPQAKPKTPWVLQIINVNSQSVQKILGKPIESYSSAKFYKRPGFATVNVQFDHQTKKSYKVRLEFEKDPADWEGALKVLGLSLDGVKAKAEEGIPGYPETLQYELTGLKGLPAKWSAIFSPKGKPFKDENGMMVEDKAEFMLELDQSQ